MKYEVKFTTQFKKDLKLAKKQNKDIDVLFSVIEQLAQGKQLDEKYREVRNEIVRVITDINQNTEDIY